MIKKIVLTVRKIFLFTIIFSIFACSICVYASLKADWITHWTKVNGSPENTPIGADEEYPKIFMEYIGGSIGYDSRIYTKSEHCALLYFDKIKKIIKERGLQPLKDYYLYNDAGELKREEVLDWGGGEGRYLLYDGNVQYGFEFIKQYWDDGANGGVDWYVMYKEKDGKYVRDKWMVLDIDFDGMKEWVYFMTDGCLLQWTETLWMENTAYKIYSEDPAFDWPEDAIHETFGTSFRVYFESGHRYKWAPTELQGYAVDPIGRWVDDNGVVQRP